MTAAYILAGELAIARDQPQAAFRRYEERLRSFIEAKQRAAERFATAFVPRTRFGLFFRNQVLKTFRGHCQVSRGWRWDDGRERLTA